MKNYPKYLPTALLAALFFVACGLGGSPSNNNDNGGGNPPPGPDGSGSNIADVLSEDQFKEIFPVAYPGGQTPNAGLGHNSCRCGPDGSLCTGNNQFYSYQALIQAQEKWFPTFFDGITSREDKLRVLAAVFAQMQKETTGTGVDTTPPYDDEPAKFFGGLCFIEEECGACENYEVSGNGTDRLQGRGVIQLTDWPGANGANYKRFSNYIYGDDRIWRDPDMISRDPELAFATALWFFSTYQKYASDPTIPTGLMDYLVHPRNDKGQKRDFAYTTFLINGGLECGGRQASADPLASNRFQAYKVFHKLLTGKDVTDSDSALDCADVTHETARELEFLRAPRW